MPKNVMCKKCNNLINGWCEKKIDSPDPNMVRDCQYFWEKTNADRIRSMTYEELADFLYGIRECSVCAYNYEDRCVRCSDGIFKWLKKPTETPKEDG